MHVCAGNDLKCKQIPNLGNKYRNKRRNMPINVEHCLCAHKSERKGDKMENVGKNGVFEQNLVFEQTVDLIYLLRQVTVCFSPGMDEHVGVEP